MFTPPGESNMQIFYIDAQGFFGYGYFVEDKELDAPNFLKTAERKKVLSNIESLGLLSAAEKAGLTLSKVLPSDCTEIILLSLARNSILLLLHVQHSRSADVIWLLSCHDGSYVYVCSWRA